MPGLGPGPEVPSGAAAATSRRHHPERRRGCSGTDRRTIDAGTARHRPCSASGLARRRHPGRRRGARERITGPSTPAWSIPGQAGRAPRLQRQRPTARHQPCSTSGQARRRHPEPRRHRPPVTIWDTFAGACGPATERSTPAGSTPARPRHAPRLQRQRPTARHRPCSTSGQARRRHPEPWRHRPPVTIRNAIADARERTAGPSTPAGRIAAMVGPGQAEGRPFRLQWQRSAVTIRDAFAGAWGAVAGPSNPARYQGNVRPKIGAAHTLRSHLTVWKKPARKKLSNSRP